MEKLSKRKLKKYMPAGLQWDFFKNTGSTFDVCFKDAVITRKQKRAVGRLDRPFFSPSGGIYFCLKTDIKPLLTINAAAGVLMALEEWGINAKVKWINDILIDGKKIAGILVKTIENKAVIGVGLNYCVKKFPSPLNEKAGSVFKKSGGINRFAALLIIKVRAALANANNLNYYIARLSGIGENIGLPDGSEARFRGVNGEGHLIYDKDGKKAVLSYGDIHL